MPLIYDADDPILVPPQRIAIYGDPKTGKTPLALSLPFGDDYWGEAVYVCADDGSESLRSCPRETIKYIHRVKPAADPKSGKYDPAAEAFEIAMTDWRKEWPAVKTLVWDTMSETAIDVLGNIADTGQFSEKKHIVLSPDTAAEQNIPMQGDFGGAQSVIERLQKRLFKSPLNLVVIFHADVEEKDNGTIVVGGPATIGKATIRKVAKPYDAVLRIEKKSVYNAETKKSEQQIIIHTDASGAWIGGVRVPGKNMMPSIVVPNDKPFSLFWPKFKSAFYPDAA